MISKELLSEVLGFECTDIWFGDEKYIYYKRIDKLDLKDDPYIFHINIYELADKCKEWVIKHGYSFLSCSLTTQKAWAQLCEIDSENTFIRKSPSFHSSTEIEATFKACEWVLEQTK